MRSGRSWRFCALICTSALAVAVAIVGPASASSRQAVRAQGGGGTITIGAEQEPDCADWIASCAGASWGTWTMMEHTMPRAYDFVYEGDKVVYTPNVLLTGEATLDTSSGQQVVTYHLNPAAVWSDGKPITSTDFKYTWDQIATGDDIYDTTGYAKIESVDDSDPTTVVVTFSESYAAWRALFGGQYGVFPSHILEGKNRDKLTANGYKWSGGPYLATWKRGVSVTLVPNPNWYGPPVQNDKVVFKFIPDTSAQFKAFEAGEVDAIYPQPQPDAIKQIRGGLGDANSYFTDYTANTEALWINNAKFPFNDEAVRQAFAYAIDRDGLVNRLFGPLGVTEAVNTINPPIVSDFADTEAFAGYQLDLDMVDTLMTGAGWEKDSDGIWAKGGKAAVITIQTTTENKRRELTEEILQAQLADAGFKLLIDNHSAADLFGKNLPKGNYQVGLYAQVATQLEPSNYAIFHSKNIPTKANKNTGQNWTRTNVPGLDALLEIVDSSTDPAVVAENNKSADGLEADAATTIPLDPLPNIALWSKSLNGPDINNPDNPIYAMFWNLSTWTKS